MLPRSAMALADLILPVLQAVNKPIPFAAGVLTRAPIKKPQRGCAPPFEAHLGVQPEVGVVKNKFIEPAFLTVQDE